MDLITFSLNWFYSLFKTDKQIHNKTHTKKTSSNENTSKKENGTTDISQSMIMSVTLWHKNNSLVL